MNDREQERREKALASLERMPSRSDFDWCDKHSSDLYDCGLLLGYIRGHRSRDEEVAELRCQVEAMQVEIDGYAEFNSQADAEIAALRLKIEDLKFQVPVASARGEQRAIYGICRRLRYWQKKLNVAFDYAADIESGGWKL